MIAAGDLGFLNLLNRFEHTWLVGKKFFESYFVLLDERPHVEEGAPTNVVGFAPCV